jgi:hypothetical protein
MARLANKTHENLLSWTVGPWTDGDAMRRRRRLASTPRHQKQYAFQLSFSLSLSLLLGHRARMLCASSVSSFQHHNPRSLFI